MYEYHITLSRPFQQTIEYYDKSTSIPTQKAFSNLKVVLMSNISATVEQIFTCYKLQKASNIKNMLVYIAAKYIISVSKCRFEDYLISDLIK